MANFLDLLKSKKTNIGIKIDSNFGTPEQTVVDLTPVDKFFPNQPQVNDQVDIVTGPITVRCERVLDRNRLDVFFSAKPSEETRTLLKDNGFRFNPDNTAWYNKDCLINRMFLASNFALHELMQDSYNDDKKTNINSYATYKDQVKDLLTELNIDCADLMIVAVDCLYSKTFKDIN